MASGSSTLNLPPGVLLPLPAPLPPSSTRRLPPPCWSNDETVALIDSYRDKWYTLRRGNLKVTHWQEVADSVSSRCPASSPPKTPVQCRHKMEKLRKRYRTEVQRAQSMPISRFTSSWVHFKLMDSMEKGPSVDGENSDSPDDDNDEEEDQKFYDNEASNTGSVRKLYRNEIGGGDGFRIRIPNGVSIAQPGSRFYGKVDQKFGSPNPNPNFDSSTNFGANCSSARPGSGKRVRESDKDPIGDMVAAIKVLGDGFVTMEHMKMKMAREIETMHMEMEMKRTQMILQSQQRIVEAFAEALSDKKIKRMSSPE